MELLEAAEIVRNTRNLLLIFGNAHVQTLMKPYLDNAVFLSDLQPSLEWEDWN